MKSVQRWYKYIPPVSAGTIATILFFFDSHYRFAAFVVGVMAFLLLLLPHSMLWAELKGMSTVRRLLNIVGVILLVALFAFAFYLFAMHPQER